MSNELKPCPFCGGEAVVVRAKSTSYFKREVPYKVKCGHCPCALAYTFFESKEQAIAAWNRRATDE